jgi:hypothetical protein
MHYRFFSFIGALIFGVIALVTVRPKRHYGHSRSLKCPRCKHHFPKLDNSESGATIPTGGYTCEHCGCRMDEFGNELMSSSNSENPSNW